MIAVIGLPGGSHHQWKRFAKKKDAQEWLDVVWQRIYANSGGCDQQVNYILTEKKASRVRYLDGTRVYPCE